MTGDVRSFGDESHLRPRTAVERIVLPMTTTQSVPRLSRRRVRIERELRALRVMEGRLNTYELLWAVPIIPGIAALVVVMAVKTQLWWGSPALTAAVAALSGLFFWWYGRRWFSLSGILIYALILILPRRLSDLVEFLWDTNAKEARRDKLERAIAQREEMLAQLDGRRS
jgi:hypothetical protein